MITLTQAPITLLCDVNAGVEHQLEVGREYQATDCTYRCGMPFFYIPELGWFHGIRFRVLPERNVSMKRLSFLAVAAVALLSVLAMPGCAMAQGKRCHGGACSGGSCGGSEFVVSMTDSTGGLIQGAQAAVCIATQGSCANTDWTRGQGCPEESTRQRGKRGGGRKACRGGGCR